jgi:hypothetical protein
MDSGLATGLLLELGILGLVNLVMIHQVVRHPGAPFTRPVAAGFLVVLAFMLPPAVETLQGRGWLEMLPQLNRALEAGLANVTLPSGIEKEEWQEVVKGLKWFLTAAFPSIVVVLWLGWLVFNALMLRWLLTRLGKVPFLSPALAWRVPLACVWLVLIPGFLLLAWQWIPAAAGLPEAPMLVALNVLILALTMYLLQGIFVAQWTLLAWGLSPAWSALVWITLLLALRSLSLALVLSLAMLGLLDNWFDFRAKKKQPEP